jgi:HNH endonuclease
MTIVFKPSVIHPADMYRNSLWAAEECFRFYVEQRRQFCTYSEILDLWLQAPYCQDCIWVDPLRRYEPADIRGEGWQVDMLLTLGNGAAVVEEIEEILKEDDDYALQCKLCQRDLRPWDKDHLWVVNYHLEERYGIDLRTPGRENPARRVRDRIFHLYDHKCFRCGSGGPLHIDHIRPRALGGDAAFRNLQPLCEPCGNLKGSTHPSDIEVFNPLYFTSPPSDAWEGLFW